MQDELKTLSESNQSTVVYEYIPEARKVESYQSESALEKEFISMLQAQGYTYLQIKEEKDLLVNLREQMELVNNYKFSDGEWDRFFKTAIVNGNDGILEKTKKIQEDNIQTIKLDNGDFRNFCLIDKVNIHNNRLQVINQYEVEGRHQNRYDVTVLVNGLPLIHIELKKRGKDIREAFNQIDRYKRDSFWAGCGLYEYIQIFVISNGTYTKYYSNTTRDAHCNSAVRQKSNTFEFTSYWADSRNKIIPDLVDFAKTFFAKHTILNILTKYCVFTSEQRLLVMRPYQIVATERIINKIGMSHTYKRFGSTEGGGYIWHTTGSGKTLTSFKTALLSTKLEFIRKVLFVVDRKDLDYQTMKEYDRFQKGCANSNTNTSILQKQLENPDSRIIITTIQKLDNFIKKNPTHSVYNEEMVIIFDECHRSQFGDMHKNIVKKFKKYYIFGFTGTPIFPENIQQGNTLATTEQLFGERLHTYTIVDAINDKNVLPFKVDFISTLRERSDIKDKKVEAIDTEKALLSDERITEIVKYILEHFAQKTKHNESYTYNQLDNVIAIAKNNRVQEIRRKANINGFNSIFAVASVESAKAYYKKFKEFDHNLKIATIYSYGANEEELDILEEENSEDTTRLDQSSRDFLDGAIKDYNKMFQTNYDTSAEKFQNYYKDVSLRMKNKEIDILIVVNMFLTGFDATTLNTLWVDKNLKYHGLIQAFSRTNRILNSVKTFGNIVCFRNLEERLNEALLLFGNKDSKGVVILKTYDEYYNGYVDGDKIFEGYKPLVERLKALFPIGTIFFGKQQRKDFIMLYGQILRVRNILTCFDQFASDTLLTQRELQDYSSMYLRARDEIKSEGSGEGVEKEDINDDIVFEMELIKQIEVNIDYILMLIKQFFDGKGQDKEILVTIAKSIDSSVELRNKKDLIMAFITTLNSGSDVYADFSKYMNEQRIIELNKIIEEEKLKKTETFNFMRKAFKDGGIEANGVEIAEILPPIRRFDKSVDRTAKKNIVVAKLIEFFNRFYTISSEDLKEN